MAGIGGLGIRSAAFLSALLASFAISGSAAPARDYCIQGSPAEAVDLSVPVSQGFLARMKDIGIKTIIRYYDHEDETLPGKTLRRGERDLISINGFKTAVVFQHYNNQFGSFTAVRGRQDTERSLALAMENAQPKGSAIYFGVDGKWDSPYELANIKDYFGAVKARLGGSGYRIGVYGSGLVCDYLLTNGLAELCWLAAPTSWPQYSFYYGTRKWRLVQLPSAQCGGRNVDFNLTNGVGTDYGQFGN